MTNDPLDLDLPGEWSGLWWLPDEPGRKVPGVLRYDPDDGLLLSLIGGFEDWITSPQADGGIVVYPKLRDWDVIHGTAEHREITLLQCVVKDSRHIFGARVMSPDEQSIKATMGLVGAHIRSEDESVFSAAEVSVENLGGLGHLRFLVVPIAPPMENLMEVVAYP